MAHLGCADCFKSGSIDHHCFDAKNSLTVSILESGKRCKPNGDPPPMTSSAANGRDYQKRAEEAACKTHLLPTMSSPDILEASSG